MLNLPLTDEQTRRIELHLQLLRKWNRAINLIGRDEGDNIIARHVLDSLAVAPFIRAAQVLDIGSGGGFPGIPLAVAMPDVAFTLLDSRGRRVAFLREVCNALQLGNVSVAHCRLQDYRPSVPPATCIARAFASLADLLAASAALQTPGARLLAMKGAYPTDEIAALPEGWQAKLRVEKLQVPFLHAARHLVVVECG